MIADCGLQIADWNNKVLGFMTICNLQSVICNQKGTSYVDAFGG
jgi:hypothetical protein